MSPISSSRPLGNLEIFFKKLADLGAPLEREHWAVHLALTLRVTDTTVDLVPYLQRSWQAVRHQYPAIGSVIIRSAQEPASQVESDVLAQDVLTIPAFDAALWSKETFFVHANETDADSLFCSLRPSPTATFHWLPQSSQVVIRSSHWRLDGIGMAKLGHVFLATLVEMLRMKAEDVSASVDPDAATQHRDGGSYLEERIKDVEAAISQEEREAYIRRLEAGADALVGEFLRGVPSIGLPTRPNSYKEPPGASARVATRLDVPTTTKIIEARRAKKLSFTGAVHAAIVRVTARYPQHACARSYAAFFPVDLRQSIVSAGAANEDQLVYGLYVSGQPLCVEGVVPGEDDMPGKAKTFDEIARQMTAVYNKDLTAFWNAPDGHQASLLELAEPFVQRTTLLYNTLVPEGLPPIQKPDLSGLGKVETYLNREYQSPSDALAPKVEVSDMWIGTERLDRCIQFHLWSWRDELRLGASFNQSFYEKSSVAKFLEQIVEELLRGLEIRVHC